MSILTASAMIDTTPVIVAFSDLPSGESHKRRIKYTISLPSGRLHIADDLRVLERDSDEATLTDGLRSLFSFLSAAAEAYGHEDSENADLFPADVMEWAYLNSDEIVMAAMNDIPVELS